MDGAPADALAAADLYPTVAHSLLQERIVESFVGSLDSVDTTELRVILEMLAADEVRELAGLDDGGIEGSLSPRLADHDTGVGEDRLLAVSFLPTGRRDAIDIPVVSEAVCGGVKAL